MLCKMWCDMRYVASAWCDLKCDVEYMESGVMWYNARCGVMHNVADMVRFQLFYYGAMWNSLCARGVGVIC